MPSGLRELMRKQSLLSRARRLSGGGSAVARAALVAQAYGLNLPDPDGGQQTWRDEDVPRRLRQGVELPEGLSPWHLPLLNVLSRTPFETRILDLLCGIPLLFFHLHRKGFAELVGVEDSTRQWGIVEAARAFLAATQTPARILDVRLHEASAAAAIFAQQGLFDVVASFGAPERLWFPLAWELLNDGGLLVAETYFADVPREFRHRFETVETYPNLGGKLREPADPVGVTIFRKLPPGTPRLGEGLERRDGEVEIFHGPDG